jgi:hypothetical protein
MQYTFILIAAIAFSMNSFVQDDSFSIEGKQAITIYMNMTKIKASTLVIMDNVFIKAGPGIQCMAYGSEIEPTDAVCSFSVKSDGSVSAE